MAFAGSRTSSRPSVPTHARARHPRRSAGSLRRAPPRRRRAAGAGAGGRRHVRRPQRRPRPQGDARGADPGRQHRIAFVAMAGTAWTLPLYELALMTAAHGRRRGLDLAIELISRESAPLGIFGAEASAAVRRRLTDAGVRIRVGTFPTEYADGRLWLELEGPLDVDLVVALPRLRGPDAARTAARARRVRAGRRLRARPRRRARVGGGRHDDPAAPAGRSRRPAGRRRRRGHRSAGRRLRRRGAAVPADAPGHAADGRRARCTCSATRAHRPLDRVVQASLGPQQKIVGDRLGPYLEVRSPRRS